MSAIRTVLVDEQLLFCEILGRAIGDLIRISASADSIEGAEKACLRHRPDLVITDYTLSDGTGLELHRRVAPVLVKARWIVLASHEDEYAVREAAKHGIQGFVTKRSPALELRNAIVRVAGGDTYYCARSSRLLMSALRSEEQFARQTLTGRELEVLRCVAAGDNIKTISMQLNISRKTVANHLASIREKLKVPGLAGIVRYAIQHGMVAEG